MADPSVKTIETILNNKKYNDLSISGNTIKVKVEIDRYSAIKDLVTILNNLGAVHDPNAPGSSIGAIKVGKVKILIKSLGRSGGLDVEAKAIETLQESITQAVVLFRRSYHYKNAS